jgi:hypothetical protein
MGETSYRVKVGEYLTDWGRDYPPRCPACGLVFAEFSDIEDHWLHNHETVCRYRKIEALIDVGQLRGARSVFLARAMVTATNAEPYDEGSDFAAQVEAFSWMLIDGWADKETEVGQIQRSFFDEKKRMMTQAEAQQLAAELMNKTWAPRS